MEASWAGLGDPRRLESYLGPFWNRLGGLLAGLAPKKVANMGANSGLSSYLLINEDVVSYMAVRV